MQQEMPPGREGLGRVVFVGNCQLYALSEVYRRTLPEERRRDATYIAGYQNITEAGRLALTEADRVVVQVTEFDQKIGDLATDVPRFLVPMIICPFLWPFAGEPHPNNQRTEFCASGPYPAEIGDRFLNAMIKDGISPDDGVRRWLETDIAGSKNVRRVAEISLDRQRKRDRACGDYRISDIIESSLASEPLFRTRGHPMPILMQHLAETLFASMGMDGDAVIAARTTEYAIPRTQVPVHPTVAAEFGMGFITADTTYRFRFEGSYTASETVHRYMRGAWNADLERAMHILHTERDAARAIPLFERAVANSPRSQIAKNELAAARHAATGRH